MKDASLDSVMEDEDAVCFFAAFLQILDPRGLPLNVLFLKVRASIMLLRNLNTPKLFNDTRLHVKTLHIHIIEATIFASVNMGKPLTSFKFL